jgi:hypothetical protein
MAPSRRPTLTAVLVSAVLPMLAGCGGLNFGGRFGAAPAPAAKPVQTALPPNVPVEDVVGRWGKVAYHREQDRARMQAAAPDQCTQPFVISRAAAPNAVMMYGHDDPQLQEMTLKGSVDGKTYVGPGAEPAGMDDREVLRADGQVMILRWVDPEVGGRLGTELYVRCSDGAPRTAGGSRRPSSNTPAGR